MTAMTGTCAVLKGSARLIVLSAALMLVLSSIAYATVDNVEVEKRGCTTGDNVSSQLDVGISVASGVTNQSGTAMEAAFRETEGILIAQRLRDEFEKSGIWGVVRLYPQPSVIPQVTVELTVEESDGRGLEIRTLVNAVTGETLLSKAYTDAATNEDYIGEKSDPFADLHAAIVSDVSAALATKSSRASYYRTVSALRYAGELIPSAFPGYLREESGIFVVRREPSCNDPMLARLRRLQDYELLFVDTIDEQLGNVASELNGAYYLWLKASKEQLDWLEIRRERSANAESSRGESTFTRLQAVYAAHRSLKIHEQELFELVLELENEARATVLYANEQIFRLSGTLEQQYQEWRTMLRQINDLESAL